MKNNIFFSVIVPTFNSEKSILRLLKSLQKQLYKKFEVIIVDDGSLDNTVSKIHQYKRQNLLDIEIVQQNNSGGPASPRNKGILKSKGDWICFLDSDDLWFSNKLMDLKNFINQNNSYHVICSNEIMINNNKIIKLNYGPVTSNFYEDLIINGNKLSTSATCVKKKFIIENKIMFNESSKVISVEDYDYWLNIAKKGGKFFFLKKYHGFYLINNNSISKNRLNHFISTRNVLNSHIIRFKRTKKIYFILRTKFRIFKSFFILAIREKNFKLLFFLIKGLFDLRV